MQDTQFITELNPVNRKQAEETPRAKKLKVKVLNTLPEPVPEQADICKSVLRGR